MFALFAVNMLVVMLTVAIHYEFLYWMTRLLPKLNIVHRARIVFGVAGGLLAHSVEVWVFGVAYYVKINTPGWGQLHGEYFDGSLLDCVYFSFTVFTTLGFGDIFPAGDLRYLIGIESLTGLVLITWTASFLYYEMQRSWSSR
ncbi:MAG: potassium channel family protein [Haliea sp.]|nr:potassium channel family protein [Haliea sp.]MDP4917937.1 potassium channel family protein [Haliea sp.]MDP5065281.1 potassium channel family protein [Haliea sp.]